MLIVGIHNTGILSSAAVLADGKLVFGCAEERLDRRKYCKYYPHRAIAAGLKQAGATLDDVDVFAIGWNPAINVGSRYRAGFSEWPAYPGERFYANPNQLLPRLDNHDFTATDQVFHRRGAKPVTITYVNHHLAHMANSYHMYGFDETVLLSCDGYGERSSTVWGIGRGGAIDIQGQIDFPHSLGSFYSAVTEFLGFRPDLDEWKVMGAAAFGDPGPFRAAMERLLAIEPDGRYRLDLSLYDHFDFDSPGLLSPAGLALLGSPRAEAEPMLQRHFDIAAAAQARLEEALFALTGALRRETGIPRLCLSGGIAMNSLFNGKLSVSGAFESVYIPFAPDDSGNSIGAALWAARRAGERLGGLGTPFLGTAHDDDAIAAALKRFGLACRIVEDPAEAAAALLAEGRIVGWFQGRMEFGQRALGGRSILANPCDPAAKDRVNLAVKYREAFRPFAPAVAAERACEYFDMPASLRVPYMERVMSVRPQARAIIPAVVHADGSGRVQTVEREAQPLFHQLITAFERHSGVPVVLNTSFNLNGEPIVESPGDAVRTFMTSGLDALIMGRHLLTKAPP